MEIYFTVLFGSAVLTAGAVILLIHTPLAIIFQKFFEDDLVRAFQRIIYFGLFISSLAAGVGFPKKVYQYHNHKGGFAWPKNPETAVEWFLFVYRSVMASSIAMASVLAVVIFVSLVLHVGLVRAKLAK